MRNSSVKQNNIPAYVVTWTDKYFHQSAFDIPLTSPNKKVIDFLSKFRKDKTIKLYRGVNKFNKNNFCGIVSWTYNKRIAKRYKEDGRVVEKIFRPEQILLDTTILTKKQKNQLGYDYSIDDREVLIIKSF